MRYCPYKCITLGLLASLNHKLLTQNVDNGNHIFETLEGVSVDLFVYFGTEVINAIKIYLKRHLDSEASPLNP